MASWYYEPGMPLSTGKIYSPGDKIFFASYDYPIGTTVRVTNPENGKSVVGQIADRGPHVKGRKLDASRGAAKKLGMIKDGIKVLTITALK